VIVGLNPTARCADEWTMSATGVSSGPVTSASPASWLMCRVDDRLLAVPLARVVETMRPLPMRPVSGVPSFVLGLSVIRGAPAPVLDVGSVLGAPGGRAGRFVTIRCGPRLVALAVESVLGIRNLADATLVGIPPLIGVLDRTVLSAIGTLDSDLLLVLTEARLVADEVWARLDELDLARAVVAS
jgi:purine-binding chemotaxis protein CheW